jgi:hypothetical protein
MRNFLSCNQSEVLRQKSHMAGDWTDRFSTKSCLYVVHYPYDFEIEINSSSQ